MTYSLIAVDKKHRFMVVATATKTPAVGESVPAILPGVGGVVSQSFTNPELRQLSLNALTKGLTVTDALAYALSHDGEPQLRQLGLMDRQGNSAAHSGSDCTPSLGEEHRPGFLSVGNLLANDGVLPAMSAAWQPCDDMQTLCTTALRCLEQAELAGGDSRGRQSAALLVGRMDANPELLIELRVDDSADPLQDLSGLLADWLVRVPSA